MPANIVIADDHPCSAQGLAAMLEERSQFEILGLARNGIEAIKLIKRHKPDCAVLDLSMPGANGLEVFLEAKRWSPETRFAIFTGNPSPAIFARLVKAGVDGLLLKTSPPEEIVAGLAEILGGAKVIGPEVQSALQSAAGAALDLTAREIEVLHGIARGQSNVQMAESLGVSPKTVDSHRTTLMRKMGVRSTATLLVRAMHDGLIDV